MSSSKNNYIGDEQKTQWVEAELVGLAYNQSPAAFIGTLLNGVIITWALWEVVSHFSLVVWLIALFVITAVRALLVWRYHSAAPDADQVWAWRLLLIGGVAAAGLIWGAAGIVLFPSHSPSHQVLLMFLLGGMAVAAVVVLAPVISAFFVFIVLALTPIGVQFLLQGNSSSSAVGLLGFSLIAVLSMVVRQLHASLVESLVLRWANSDLIRHITAGKEEALAQAHELAVSEQTLARQNTLLQSILSCMQESLLAADENGRFIVFNQSAQQTLGIGATGKSLLVRDINTGIYLPDQYTPCPMEHLPLIRAMRGEGVMEAELFIRRLGEDEGHWVSVNARPLVDDQGVLRGGVAIGRDISAQKRTLDMLRAHGQRLVEAQKLANMGSWEWEIATNTVTWSDELWYLYGLTPGQFPLSYESFIDRLVPEDRELVSEVISTALRKCELFAFDHRIIRADGCIRSMQSRGTVVLDREGTPIRMLGSEQDITERIETEEQLRFQKTLLECQGEASPDGILVVDAARHWISYNHRFIEMWNIPEHISEARSSDAALQWVRDKVVDSQSFIEKIRSLYGDEHKNEKLQDKVLLRDGRVFEQYSAPVTDAEGRSYGRVWHYHDITDRHVAEQQKAEFVSMVSHELRTPLTSIRASLGLLVGSGLGELSGPGRRMVEIAVANSDRLIRLINDILDTEQMEAGNVSLDKQACDVGTLMTQAVETMHGLAESAQVRLSVHPLSALLWADPDRVLQTLTNLLSNAIKFSPPASTVQVSARREGQQVVVQVKDQGRGIPADKLETIFDRFQQVFATDRREKDGAGLGLAICRNIVRQHGGRIWVESEQGKGSIFFVAFPLAQKDGVSENGGPVRDPAVPTAKPVSRRQAGGGGSTNTFYRYRALWSRRYVGILRQAV